MVTTKKTKADFHTGGAGMALRLVSLIDRWAGFADEYR